MGHKKLDTQNPEKTYPKFLTDVSKGRKLSKNNHPVVINMLAKEAAAKLQKLIKSETINSITDNYGEQYAELLLSKNAHLYRANYDVQTASIAKMLREHYGSKKSWELGAWVYFPWNGNLTHVLAQDEFEDLRSIRNRDLITAEEQAVLADFSAACFGMSVGSAGALALAISGISRKIKLVDGAVISGSNLNRILTGVSSVGRSKCEVIGNQIYMRVSLEIERSGLSQATSAATVEAATFHEDIEKLLGTNQRLQAAIRIGKGVSKRKYSPRVSAKELIT